MRWGVFAKLWLCGLAAIAGWTLATAALADTVTIQRPVTVREAPTRRSKVVTFPDVGASLRLLDDGARSSGYYHVELPDGRQGWVYYTFVRRSADAVAALEGLPSDRIVVHYIDVDQGAAALLEFPCGVIMIDTGGRGDAASRRLIDYLDAFFARRTDLDRRLATVFVTHTHIDHNSNLKAVAQRYRIGAYVHNGVLNGSGRTAARWMAGFPPNVAPFAASVTPAISLRPVSQQEVEAAGGAGLSDDLIDPLACARVDPKIRVLSGRYDNDPGWPQGEFENGNNQSLVIRVDYGSASFLFTGDMEEAAIETLVERYAGGAMLDVDVYLAGHHGSYNGTTLSLLDAMSPEMAVISMGRPESHEMWTAWAYGHPRRNLVAMLSGAVSGRRSRPADVLVAEKVKTFSAVTMDRAVYATGWDGDVVISSGADGVLRLDAPN